MKKLIGLLQKKWNVYTKNDTVPPVSSQPIVYGEIMSKETGIDQLKNVGILTVNMPEVPPKERTIIVLGVPRSGTSMIAGALHHMGVFMGDKLSNVFEDPEVSEAATAPNLSGFSSLLTARNAQHAVWGWKRPDAISSIKSLEAYFRNPYYVVVFKDLFSIAYRNRVSMREDVFKNMEVTLQNYAKLISFLQETKCPCMLTSYEKALANKEVFIEQLASFVGVDSYDKAAVSEFISPNPAGYLNESRITHGMGSVDKVSATTVAGWAKYAYVDKTAEVALYINGEKMEIIKADKYRDDLLKGGHHKTGMCGFEFTLKTPLQIGDDISVRVDGDVKDLPCRNNIFKG